MVFQLYPKKWISNSVKRTVLYFGAMWMGSLIFDDIFFEVKIQQTWMEVRKKDLRLEFEDDMGYSPKIKSTYLFN